IRTDVHNYNFTEEDTFDLALMEESFKSSKFINKQLSRKQTKQNGYPALDVKYSHKNGSVSIVKYVIQGPHYYTLIAHGKKEHPKMLDFLNSFTITPYHYGNSEKRIDTSLSFTVTTPVFPEENKMPLQGSFAERYEDEEEALVERGIYKNKLIVNDTTGEKIYVSYYKPPKYNNNMDSSRLNSIDRSKASWIIKNKRKYELPNKIRVWEYAQMDTGSSRFIWNKLYYKDGIEYLIRTQSDTLSEPSTFLTGFFETFLPADTARDLHFNVKKSTLFFNDFFSKDSIAYKKAIKNINMAEFDGTDLPLMQKAINSLTWKEKKYIDIKKQFISKLSDVPGKASAEYLKQLYYSAGDTVELQYVALESLLRQKTPYAYTTFKNIMLNEPPVLNVAGSFLSPAPPVSFSNNSNNNIRLSNGVFIDNLRDSLQLTATIFKDLLPLIDLDDYKLPLLQLLGTLVDSGFIEAGDYKMYLPNLLPEARQQLKKQIIAEKNKSIRKAQADETNTYEYNRYMVDQGNNLLSLYASLLLPFWDTNENVPVFFQQLLSSSDNRLKYNTALLLLRKGKPVPDSVLQQLAVSDKYQYDLYNDLRKFGKNDFYKNFNATELAKSRLISSASMYYVFDSIQFLDKLPVTYKGKKGFIYFFKYKQRRDDNNWKLASSGLMPINLATDKTPDNNSREENFTQVSATKLNNDEPLKQ
ncbi:MAG TPA: hypothetical protein VNA26_07320, partial [Chitinophagaceae bacterium]|nr:hypothetical protein [Chitinophagaceae bacterium]